MSCSCRAATCTASTIQASSPPGLVFIYTPGGAEGLFVEGGDEPQPGVQMQPWGPERIDERMVGLLVKYDTGLPSQ